MILLKHQPAFAGKDVLDIGVGTGRTTAYLGPLARRYQAIDYSAAMVDRFKQNFTDVPIALADMADLRVFADASFDFVLATNNVLSAVGHEARLRTLQEIRRVLRPSGMLVFSSHNRNDVHGLGRHFRPEFARNPLTQLALAARWCVASFNHARLAHRQLFTDEYAIVNDEAHGGTLLHYYISPDRQRRQLASCGFELLEMYDRRGRPMSPGDDAARSQWVFYVAKRIQVS
ncbi:MAG: methyltransferase domain-containing protein [Pseudomonadota bacterium]